VAVSARGVAAIVGVADEVSPTGVLERYGRDLHTSVARAALADAGLTFADVDGIAAVGNLMQASELAEHLERTGFEVRRITYTNFLLLPLLLSVRFAQRLSGHRESDIEITVPREPINAILAAVLAVEAQALKLTNMPAGSSLLALARKPL